MNPTDPHAHPPQTRRPSALADVAVLIDGPPTPRDHPDRADAARQRTDALQHTLDACHALGLAGNALFVALRRPDEPQGPFHRAALRHPARPAIVQPEGQAVPADTLPADAKPFTLLLQPGVTPTADGLAQALRHLDQQAGVAAVTVRVTRDGGAIHAHPLPTALHAAACLIRTRALQQAHGFSRLLPPGFAADLDLTARLLRDGHRLDRFDDLMFHQAHAPTPHAPTGREQAHVLRDALLLHERYLPDPLRKAFRRHTVRHACLLSAPENHHHLVRALRDARRAAAWERQRGRSSLPKAALDALLGWTHTHRAIKHFARAHRVRRVAFAGHHPLLPVAKQAARAAGLQVDLLLDDTLPQCKPPATLLRLPIRPLRAAFPPHTQAVIVTDLHPATAQSTADLVAERFAGPTLQLLEPQPMPDAARFPGETDGPLASDEIADRIRLVA